MDRGNLTSSPERACLVPPDSAGITCLDQAAHKPHGDMSRKKDELQGHFCHTNPFISSDSFKPQHTSANFSEAMALFPVTRDLGPVLLLALTAFLWKKHFYMRGLTYRRTVVPVARERLLKSIFYLGFLGTLDTVLRRSGQVLSTILPKALAQLLPSEMVGFLLRLCLLHLPWALWAYRGPLSEKGSTRDDRGWSDAVTRSALWRNMAKCFGTRIVLSEEWRQLSEEQRRRWFDRHYVRGSEVRDRKIHGTHKERIRNTWNNQYNQSCHG